MPNNIPTDKAAIEAELKALLEATPTTTDRGRLFHLIDAAIKQGTSGGSSSGGASVYNAFGYKYTVEQANTSQDEVNAGSMVFTNPTNNTIKGCNSVQISSTDHDGNYNDLLQTIISLLNTADVGSLGYLMFNGTPEAAAREGAYNAYAIRKIRGVSADTGNDSFTFDFDPVNAEDLEDAVWATSITDLDGTFEWFFKPSEISSASSGGDVGFHTQGYLGSYTAGTIGGNPNTAINDPNKFVVDAGDGGMTALYLPAMGVEGNVVANMLSNCSARAVFAFVPDDSNGSTNSIRIFEGNFGGVTQNFPFNYVSINGGSAGGFHNLVEGANYKVFMTVYDGTNQA